jgi:hypothetical protein
MTDLYASVEEKVLQLKTEAKVRAEFVKSAYLLKDKPKYLNSKKLNIDPIFYGMKNKVSNNDAKIKSLKMSMATVQNIRYNAQQLQNAMDERPLTGQFSILLKKKLEANSATRYRNQGLSDGSGAYSSGMNMYNYKKAEKKISREVDKREKEENKIQNEDVVKNRNVVLDKIN